MSVTLPLRVQLNTSKFPVVYTYEFAFERRFDHEWGVGLFQENWTIGFPLCAIYGVFILLGKRLMSDRAPWNLRRELTAWSLGLAIFSWLGLLRSWEETIYMMRTYGFESLVCDSVGYMGASGLWAWLFAVSKLVEFGDTAFIVLRKQRLIFLHWYHHITALLYTWYSYAHYSSTGRCFLVMNYTVHAFMYAYYALKASRLVRVPRRASVCITLLQITQMFTGILVNLYAHVTLKRGDACSVSRRNLEVSFLLYASFFVLFAHYFYGAYFKKGDVKPDVKPDKPGAKKTN